MTHLFFWLIAAGCFLWAFDLALAAEIQLAEQMQDEGDDYLRVVHGN